MNLDKLKQYQFEVEQEIKTNILPFWSYKALDEENGGFCGLILNDLTRDTFAEKGRFYVPGSYGLLPALILFLETNFTSIALIGLIDTWSITL